MASVDALASASKKRLPGASFRHPPGGGGGGAWTGMIKVEKVMQKSVATTVYARYPLKYLLPSKVASSRVDCAWVYAISYGGGILSKDTISQALEVGAGCSVVMTTQSSTKIYKSGNPGGKEMAQQLLQARVAAGGFLAVLPDPITCFRASRYVQLQEFVLALDASLLLVDWLTSGRIVSGESWDFELYRSTNHIFVEQDEEEEESKSKPSRPLLLDCVQLENGVGLSIAERMQGFHVLAMVVIYGPQLLELRKKMETKVEEMMIMMTKQRAFSNQQRRRTTSSAVNATSLNKKTNHHHQYHHPPRSSLPNATSDCNGDGDGESNPSSSLQQPPLILASCSPIGISDEGLVVRVVASSTETVYNFLREQLAPVISLLGACPYASR